MRAIPDDFATRPDALKVFTGLHAWHPWGGYSTRRAARAAGRVGPQRPEFADAALETAARRYPIDARQWLDRARLAPRHPKQQAFVDAHLEVAAAVQPGARSLRWRGAMLAVQAGRLDLAETHLRQWLDGNPGGTARALFAAGRWIDEPSALIDRILPDSREHKLRALEYARVNRLDGLAGELWSRTEAPGGPDDPALLARVDLLLREGRGETAAKLWADADPGYRPGSVPNGDFARPLGPPRGLNWRAREQPGYRLGRADSEFHSEPASLAVAFDGSENVRLNAWIWIPLQPARRYRVNGWWKAGDLTTRALPRVRLWAPGAGTLGIHELPDPDFGWQPWSLDFRAPEEGTLVRLIIERLPTDNFDRRIAGTLWVDDLDIREMPSRPARTEVSDD